MRNILNLLLISIFVMGCATTPGTQKPISNTPDAPKTLAATEKMDVELLSLRERERLSRADCPKSEKAWKGNPWRRLVVQASSCAAYEQWAQLEIVAQHLAVTEPQLPWGFFYLSLVSEQRRQAPKALWLIEQAINKDGTEALFVYQKARLLWISKEPTMAMQFAERAVGMNKNFIDARLFLAEVYWSQEMLEEAVPHLEYVLRNEPRHGQALRMVADSLYRLRKFEPALGFLQRLVLQQPKEIWPRVRIAKIFEEVDQNYTEALTVYRNLQAMVKRESLQARLDFDLNKKVNEVEAQVRSKSLSMREPAKQRGKK